MERTSDENQIIKDQIKAFDEQINATKSSSYDIAAFPENYEVEKKFGFKMKGDDFEFLKVAERLKNYINTKDKQIEVRKIGVTIKCIKADMQGKNIQMSIRSDTVDKGTMNLTFSKRLYSGRAVHFWTKGAPILTKIFVVLQYMKKMRSSPLEHFLVIRVCQKCQKCKISEKPGF